MIIDASVLLAIVFKEPERFAFFHAISEADRERRGGHVALFEQLVREIGIIVRPFTAEHAVAGWQAFRLFGKGRHRARLTSVIA